MIDYKLVPVEPTPEHIDSIAMRHRHDFGLLPEDQRDNLRRFARQMYEECTGQGFYQIQPAPAVQGEPVAWLYEDELPDNYPYEAMFPYSKVDGVRIFPVYAPQPAEQQPSPDVAGLMEALEEIAQSCDSGRHDGLPEDGPALDDVEAWLVANDALAAYRKGGDAP